MKHIYVIILLIAVLLGVFAAKAQNNKINDDYHPLVQEGKNWSVAFVTGDLMEGYKFVTTRYTLFGDTIINDILYKKMYASTKEFPQFPQDWVLQNFMREDEDKKVWYKNKNSEEKLYYDFSLEIGNTLPDNLGLSDPPYYPQEPVVVENITSITMLNGEERKVWHLSIMCNGALYQHKEYWIEGIGSSLGVINPLGGGLVGGFDRLLCVHINEELVYNANLWGGVCYISGSIGINSYDKRINIYPNPANNVVFIENIDNLEIRTISILNIQGQIVKHYEATTTQLDVSCITEGVYFIKLSSSKEEAIKKIMIKK